MLAWLQEHIIHVWGETASLFHNVLALHYKDVISEKMEEYLRALPPGSFHCKNLFKNV